MLANQFLANNSLCLPNCHSKAILQLLLFPSLWDCEQGFSAMMSIKTKSRNRLTSPSHDFRCAVSAVDRAVT